MVAARGVLNPGFSLELLAGEMSGTAGLLDLLVDADREVDLREVFGWSYRALSSDAAVVLRALVVHPGPEISLAVLVSLAGLSLGRVRAAVAGLTGACLLWESAPGRFTVHDLVRCYALERAGGDVAGVTARLLAHYVYSTRAACLRFGRPPLVELPLPPSGVVPECPSGPVDAVGWYQRERAVLQAVVRRAADLGEHHAVLHITLDWRPMSDNVDADRDLLPYIRLALHAATALEIDDEGDVPLALLAECHRDAAAKLARTGEPDAARHHYHAALHRFEQLGDLAGEANTLRNMAMMLVTNPDERITVAARAVTAARRCDVPTVLAASLNVLGEMLRLTGRTQDAFPVFQEALALAERHPGGDHLAHWLLAELAQNYAAAGDVDEAVAFGERALDGARRFDSLAVELDLLPTHGDALLAAGHPARARQAWKRYLALSANTGIADTVAIEAGRTATATARDIHTKLSALPVTAAEP
jgi:tetratricopeptide (TPR) repeat protein